MKEFEQAVSVLPARLRQVAMGLSQGEREVAEEVRLRCGWPLSVVLPWGEFSLGEQSIVPEDLDQVVEIATRASLHSSLHQLRRGFLTVPGGHRLGLCGTAVMEGDEVRAIRGLSCLSIRVARQVRGAARPILSQLIQGDRLCSTLIAAPPGLGKTTLLRDLVRSISLGEGCPPLRIGLADERGEVAALWNGVPQLDIGSRTDVIEGCPKAQGAMMLLRAMNPQVLAMDEITAPEDVSALLSAAGCGAALLATAHGAGEELSRRPLYRPLLAEGVFQRLVTIRCSGRERVYEVKELTSP